VTDRIGEMRIEFGEYVRAADRYEMLKPPYQAVKDQDATPRGTLKVVAAKLAEGGKTLVLTTDPHPLAVHYALTVPGVKGRGQPGAGATVDIDYDLSGVRMLWGTKPLGAKLPNPIKRPALNSGVRILTDTVKAERWLPYPDLVVSERLLRPLSLRSEGFGLPEGKAGELGLLIFRMQAPLDAESIRLSSTNVFLVAPNSSRQGPAVLNLASGRYEFDVAARDIRFDREVYVSSVGHIAPISFSYRVSGANYLQSVPRENFRPDWVTSQAVSPAPPPETTRPALVGGDWLAGKDLFFGDRLKCSTCHRVRSEGGTVGPDLSNLPHRDAASVLRDIKEPSATINPDYVAFNVELKGGGTITGFVRAQDADSLSVVGADGQEMKVPRSEVADLRASSVSLMPEGLLAGLTGGQVRDLLTFLLSEPPTRTRHDVDAVLAGTSFTPSPAPAGVAGGSPSDNHRSRITNHPVRIVLVASKQDHGPGQHDYPAWQQRWHPWLGGAPGVTVEDAWLWPTPGQFQSADVLVFYFWNHDWNAGRYRQLDEFLARGGGIVLLHSATIADKDPEQLAERIGLASQPGRSHYRHTPLDLRMISSSNSPITRGLPPVIHFLDEPYWPLIGDTNRVRVLATTVEDGRDQPLVWTFEKGRGRVFGCVLGHFTWTLDDPLYRLLVLRGLDWAAGGTVTRFDGYLAGSLEP
ncbi:MAG: ThuA domain-containing protein, partial [Verrucomicrobia bacterium]|nr:ThuA domain-containing protein [Verrucomicrobiota bacterium]